MKVAHKERIGSVVSSFFDVFFDLVFPKHCLGCKKEGGYLCAVCDTAVRRYASVGCAVCIHGSVISGENELCLPCQHSLGLDSLTVACAYDDPLARKLIHSFKYAYVEELSVPLAAMLSEAFTMSGTMGKDVTLVPVPLHRRRELARGFNQARGLADALAATSRLPVADCLRRTMPSTPQAQLSKQNRRANVENIFAVAGEVPSGRLLLVDDVFTTGATVAACARVLKTKGAPWVGALVLAKGKL